MNKGYIFFYALRKFLILLLATAAAGALLFFGYNKMFHHAEYSKSFSLIIDIDESKIKPVEGLDVPDIMNLIMKRGIFLLENAGLGDKILKDQSVSAPSAVSISAKEVSNAAVIRVTVSGQVLDHVLMVSRGLPEALNQSDEDFHGQARLVADLGNDYVTDAPSAFRAPLLGAICGFAIPYFFLILAYFLRNPVTNIRQLSELVGSPAVDIVPNHTSQSKQDKALRLLATYLKMSSAEDKTIAFLSLSAPKTGDDYVGKIAENLRQFGLNVLDVHCSEAAGAVIKQGDGSSIKILEPQDMQSADAASKIMSHLKSDFDKCDKILVRLQSISDSPVSLELSGQLRRVFFLVRAGVDSEEKVLQTRRLLAQMGVETSGAALVAGD